MNSSLIEKIFFCLLVASSSSPVLAAPTTPARPQSKVSPAFVDTTGLKDSEIKVIAGLEMSHFHRTFDGDPADKRVKRLELLLAGAGQDGTWQERVAGLKDLAARRAAAPSHVPTKYGASQSLTQLELSINKKADPRLDITTRLSNLEKKVFGNVFSNIPVEQRIARLQKTMGVGSNEDLADGMAGMPQSMRQFGTLRQGFPPSAMFNSPFMSPYMPDEMSPDVNQHMSDMFDHLNQQLRQLHKLPPGYGYQSLPRQYSSPESNYDFSDGLPPIPKDGLIRQKPQLPPYMDPNSI